RRAQSATGRGSDLPGSNDESKEASEIIMAQSSLEIGWFEFMAPKGVYHPAAAASGTYQSTRTGVLHVLTADQDIYVQRGTGSSVTASSSAGLILYAKTMMYFRPLKDEESVGWAIVGGTNANVRAAVIERSA